MKGQLSHIGLLQMCLSSRIHNHLIRNSGEDAVLAPLQTYLFAIFDSSRQMTATANVPTKNFGRICKSIADIVERCEKVFCHTQPPDCIMSRHVSKGLSDDAMAAALTHITKCASLITAHELLEALPLMTRYCLVVLGGDFSTLIAAIGATTELVTAGSSDIASSSAAVFVLHAHPSEFHLMVAPERSSKPFCLKTPRTSQTRQFWRFSRRCQPYCLCHFAARCSSSMSLLLRCVKSACQS